MLKISKLFFCLIFLISIQNSSLAADYSNPFAPGYFQNTNPFGQGYVQDTNPFGQGYIQDTNPFGNSYVQDKGVFGFTDNSNWWD